MVEPIPMDDDNGAAAHQQQLEAQMYETTTETLVAPPLVYAAIAKVMAALATDGISKTRTNTQQGYKFRGIDDVYNALARHLSNAGLCVLPKVVSREVVERQSAKGGALFYVVVQVEFAFVCAEDGSNHVVTTFGEAMDSGDKATNKAMSAAYKYAAMQAFCIPTEGDNDADATTHDVAPAAPYNEAEQLTLQHLRDASLNGMKALETQWKGITETMRDRLRPELASLKDGAAKAKPVANAEPAKVAA